MTTLETSLWDSMLPMETKRHVATVDDGGNRANWGEMGAFLTSVD